MISRRRRGHLIHEPTRKDGSSIEGDPEIDTRLEMKGLALKEIPRRPFAKGSFTRHHVADKQVIAPFVKGGPNRLSDNGHSEA